MTLRDALEAVETAEEIFALFGLEFDERVLRIHRLRVIKRFSREVAAIEATSTPGDETERWGRYAAALQRAHDYYLHGPPPGAHEFAGVQRGLVSLSLPRKA